MQSPFDDDPELEAVMERCSVAPLLRLRFVRPARQKSPVLPNGYDRGVACCLLSDFLSDSKLETTLDQVSEGWGQGDEPANHPRKRAEERLKSLMRGTGIDKVFKITDGPYGFRCNHTGLWGIRVELTARRQMAPVNGERSVARAQLNHEMGEILFGPLARAGGFAFSAVVQVTDVVDCGALFDAPGRGASVLSLVERAELDRSSGVDTAAPMRRPGL